jgi:cysteine-rich repeat protein
VRSTLLGAAALATVTLASAPAYASVLLNEVLVNPPGADDAREYVEIRATASDSLSGVWLLEIEGDGAGAGVVENALDLSAAAPGANGLLLVGNGYEASVPWPAVPSETARWNLDRRPSATIENGSVTFLLVRSFSGAPGTDLDTDDDGVLDATPWDEVLDGVGWRDPAVVGRVYSPAVVTPSSGVPDAATRLPGDTTPSAATAWYGGDVAASGASPDLSTTYDVTHVTAGFPAPPTYVSLGMLTPGAPNVPELALVAVCGDGALDAGEECDDGNVAGGDCCSSACTIEPAGTVCRAAATPCDAAEACNGADADCPPDGSLSDGSACDDGDACTAGDRCAAGGCAGDRDPLCDLAPFLCHKNAPAKAPRRAPAFPKFAKRKGDAVVDALAPPQAGDQHLLDLLRPVATCARAGALGAGEGHLAAYAAKVSKTDPRQPKPVKTVHTVENVLGTLRLQVQGSARVLAPATLALGTDGPPLLPGAGLDAFRCYRARVARESESKFARSRVALRDPLAGERVLELVGVSQLCAPASLNGGDPAAASHAGHLLCYKARLAKLDPPQAKDAKVRLSVATAFGPEVLDVGPLVEVCLPSLRRD